jgi:hypothetical protein
MGRITSWPTKRTAETTNLQKKISRFVMITIALTLSDVMIMLVTWLLVVALIVLDLLLWKGILAANTGR